MRTATELLSAEPPAPLAATLSVRPIRACVLVPSVDGVPWQWIVEHAIATQCRVWGGQGNLIVPTGWEIREDELFLRLLRCFNPDLLAVHAPTHSDVEEIAPDAYAATIADADRQLSDLGFGEQARADELQRLRGEVAWGLEPTAELHAKLIETVAPLRHDDEVRSTFLNGSAPPTFGHACR